MDNDGALLEVLRNTYKGLRFRWKYRGLIILPAEQGNAAAADAIRAGQLVAVPTETVYGLAGNGLDPKAVAQIYEVKGRPSVKPLSLMVHDASAMARYCDAGRGLLARAAHDRAARQSLRARDRARGRADRRPALSGSPGHARAH